MVAVVVLEGRVAFLSMPHGQVPAVVGQADRQRDRRPVDQQEREPERQGQVRDVEVIGIIPEQPLAAGDQVAYRGPFGREGLAPPGDLGPEVGREVVVEPAGQPVGVDEQGGLLQRFSVGLRTLGMLKALDFRPKSFLRVQCRCEPL